MSLNDTMERLRSQHNPSKAAQHDEPLTIPDEMPTIRDFVTALYKLKQQPTCRNCLRRERGDCPNKTPMPKTCVSFQLSSRQMQTYGQQARNAIKAWRDAISIHAAREFYRQMKESERNG